MTTNSRVPLLILVGFMVGFYASGACAQSTGLDEAVGPNGVTPRLQLSSVQRNAVYNAVVKKRMRSFSPGIVATIGAPVPPSVALRDLPDQAMLGAHDRGLLKYATVADEVVLVDPIRMRVVDVIRQGAGP